MRSLVAGSLVMVSLALLAGACGDDGDSPGTGGGDTTSSSSTSAGGNGGGGTGGGSSGECTAITIPAFDYLGSGLFGGAYFGGAPSPAIDGAAEDIFVLEVWNPELSGAVDLGSATNLDYQDCDACALVYADLDAEQNPTKIYFQQSGTLTVDSLEGGYYLQGSLSNVQLVEVTQNEETGGFEPVAGGACITINSQPIAIDPPVAGWSCDPSYYEDGEYCDCQCGAVDTDCSNAALPIDGCYEGQTCSSDGSACEGIPTAWTCDDAQFGSSDGCNCACGTGVLDPDCEANPTPVSGCQSGETCNPNGACLPAAWTCPPADFGDGLFCDCECGAVDPDCAIEDSILFGCEDGEVCNAEAQCVPASNG